MEAFIFVLKTYIKKIFTGDSKGDLFFECTDNQIKSR